MEALRVQLANVLKANERLEADNAWLRRQHEQQGVRIDTLTVEVRAIRQELRATATRSNQKLDRLLDVHKESRQVLQDQIADLEEQLRRATRKRTIDPAP